MQHTLLTGSPLEVLPPLKGKSVEHWVIRRWFHKMKLLQRLNGYGGVNTVDTLKIQSTLLWKQERKVIMSGYALATKTYMIIHVSSDLQKANCKIVCCEKALKPITPSWCFEHQWQREKNFGMGKVNWMTTIGNSHTSQKRCQRLNDDWCLNSVQMLKVQSSLQGNLKGYTDGWS